MLKLGEHIGKTLVLCLQTSQIKNFRLFIQLRTKPNLHSLTQCCNFSIQIEFNACNCFIHKVYYDLLLLLSRFSRVRLYATPQTAAHQAPPSLGFSRQEHWSGLPFPSPCRLVLHVRGDTEMTQSLGLQYAQNRIELSLVNFCIFINKIFKENILIYLFICSLKR